MSPQMKTALILLAVTVVVMVMGRLCKNYLKQVIRFQPGPLREPLDRWPKRNEGGGYHWPDGRITPDRDGLGPDLRER